MMRLAPACIAACALAAGIAAADNARTAAVEADIAAMAREAGGTVGVAAWRLDGRGPEIALNADERFPMASTFKVAVAGTVLAAVDRGELTLDHGVAIALEDYVPSDVIAGRLIHPGVRLSVHNLIELMLTESDNTATDVLMALGGGASRVTAWVREQGIEGQRIDRDTAGLLRDFFGLPAGPLAAVAAAAEKADPRFIQRGSQPNAAFDADARDTSTPRAMAGLLERIFGGKALSAASTAVLTGAMERCRTGAGRLNGRMPAGSAVAHKTGTIGGSLNDVGLIRLPQDRGEVVIAVFIKESALPFERREAVIADIARSVRDFYLYSGER